MTERTPTHEKTIILIVISNFGLLLELDFDYFRLKHKTW